MAREDEIRLIAYNIWQEENCPPGQDCEHWYRAEAVWEKQQKAEVSTKKSQAESKPTARQQTKSSPAKRKSTKA